MDINNYMEKVGKQAKSASYLLAKVSTEQKNTFLDDLSKKIIANEQEIIDANKKDDQQKDYSILPSIKYI